MKTRTRVKAKCAVSVLLTLLMVLTLLPATMFAQEPAEIPYVALTGITAPVVGEIPTISGITTSTEGVRIFTSHTHWSEKDEELGSWREFKNKPFENGKSYRLYVYIAPTDSASYKFAKETSATVNGNPASYVQIAGVTIDPERDRVIQYEYEPLGGGSPVVVKTIESVAITGVHEPVNNELPTYKDITTSVEGVKMELADIFWLYDEDGSWYTMSGRFFDGGTYGIRMLLDVTDDSKYVFSDSLSVTVNGKNAQVKGTGVTGDERKVVICSFGKLGGTSAIEPSISTETLQDGTVGEAYSQKLSAYGSVPITWSIESGSLPAGLTLSGDTISGVPETAESQIFTIKATNSAGTHTKKMSIAIKPAAPTVAFIKSVSVTGLPTPEANEACSIDGYTLTTDPENAANVVGLCWYDKTDDKFTVSATDKFIADHEYYVWVRLEPKEGYAFEFDSASAADKKPYTGKAYISGEEAVKAVEFDYSDTGLHIAGKVIKIEAKDPGTTNVNITSVIIKNVQMPVAGEFCTTDGITMTTDPADSTEDATFYWYDETDKKSTSATDKFVEGHEYSINVPLMPRTGYAFEFAPMSTKYTGEVKINDKDADIAESAGAGLGISKIMGAAKADGGTTPPAAEYKFTAGDGGVYTKGSGKTLEFTADGPKDACTGIEIDGALLAESNYTLVSGSTIITLKNVYLETLSVGDHSISVIYGNTEAKANFKVAAASAGGNDGNNNGGNSGGGSGNNNGGNSGGGSGNNNGVNTGGGSGNNNGGNSGGGSGNNNGSNTGNKTGNISGGSGQKTDPKTGDAGNMFMWIALQLISCCGIGLVTYCVLRRKKSRSK